MLLPASIRAATQPAVVPIAQVQGGGSASPYIGKATAVAGVVVGIQRTGSGAGFYLQDPKGDGDPATSDGIFVRMGEDVDDWQSRVALGARATASGTVDERGGMTSVAVASERALKVSSRASLLPLQPEALDIPVDAAHRAAYLEAREGMMVTIPDAMVVGPTNVYGQYVAVDAQRHGPRRMGSEPDKTGFVHVNGKLGPKPQLVVGDRVSGMRGPLGVTNGNFEVLPVGNYKALERGPRPPRAFGDMDGDDTFTETDRNVVRARFGQAAAGPLDAADLNGDGKISKADLARLDARIERQISGPSLRIATFNAFNFFDPVDAPPPIDDPQLRPNEYRTKLAKLAGTIRDRLGAPELLAMQEIENTAVLDDMLARPELAGLGYKYVMLPTTGRRSINPALLYRGEGIEVTGTRQLQRAGVRSEESVLAGPRSAVAPARTEPGPLFAREPLVVDLKITAGDDAKPRELTVIVNHLISKFSPHGLPTDPIRIEQAKFLRGEVERLRAEHPDREVIVLGDMNDTEHSPAIKELLGPKRSPTLVDATATLVPEGERYSYVYEGRSELIDHIAVTPGLVDEITRAGVRHGNADLPRGESWDSTPSRASDHDSPYLWLNFGAEPAAARRSAAP